ncbi:MAG: RNA 3'-terminal phosphate cyclase, partial [Candidatus Woesearchaeota archaeon]
KSQHLYAIRAFEQLCNAKTEGAFLASQRLFFEPGELVSKDIKIDIGTAGSVTLVLQALMLPCLFTEKAINIKLRGGTDVAWSPSSDYFKYVVLPQLCRFSKELDMKIVRRGYYPKGGGLVEFYIKPRWHVSDYDSFEDFLTELATSCPAIKLVERGGLKRIIGLSHAAEGLAKARVAERQAEAAAAVLNHCFQGIKTDIDIQYCPSTSMGSGITLWAIFSTKDKQNPICLGADALGERGKRAEAVGEEAAQALTAEINSQAAVDKHLADTLIPYMPLVRPSRIKTSQLTSHTITNIYVVEQFLGKAFEIDEKNKEIWTMMQ